MGARRAALELRGRRTSPFPNAIASLRQRRSDEARVFDAQDWMHVPLQRCAIILTSHEPARINTITKTKAIAFTTMRCR